MIAAAIARLTVWPKHPLFRLIWAHAFTSLEAATVQLICPAAPSVGHCAENEYAKMLTAVANGWALIVKHMIDAGAEFPISILFHMALERKYLNCAKVLHAHAPQLAHELHIEMATGDSKAARHIIFRIERSLGNYPCELVIHACQTAIRFGHSAAVVKLIENLFVYAKDLGPAMETAVEARDEKFIHVLLDMEVRPPKGLGRKAGRLTPSTFRRLWNMEFTYEIETSSVDSYQIRRILERKYHVPFTIERPLFMKGYKLGGYNADMTLAFVVAKSRDAILLHKRELCRQNQVSLIEIVLDEMLDLGTVIDQRLKELGIE